MRRHAIRLQTVAQAQRSHVGSAAPALRMTADHFEGVSVSERDRPLDDTDLLLLDLLAENARKSNVELGREIGIVEGAVRKRLSRLLAEGYVRIVGSRSLQKLGYESEVIVGIQVQAGASDDVVRRLQALPAIQAITLTTGRYDIMVRACFRSRAELEELLTSSLPGIHGVARTETSYVLSNPKRSFDAFDDEAATEPPSAYPPLRVVRAPYESGASRETWWMG